jgi:diacylglycerol kinase
MYLKKRLKAIGYAFYGIIQAFQQEAHLKLQALIALAVICVGFYCHLNAFEWFMVTTVITLVICLEMLNSAIEKLCDQVTLERNPKIRVWVIPLQSSAYQEKNSENKTEDFEHWIP